jgi:hypothetical protein
MVLVRRAIASRIAPRVDRSSIDDVKLLIDKKPGVIERRGFLLVSSVSHSLI